MIQKIIIFMLLLCQLPIFSQEHKHTQLLVFTNPCIHSLDGLPLGIDGNAVLDMRKTLRKVREMLFGQKVGNKNLGNYTFNTNQFSIRQLVELEKENPHNSELTAVLNHAKQDFIKLYKPFIVKMAPAKKLLINLINEFCEKRARHDSVLLSWSSAKSGQEFKAFNHEIKSFAQLDIFLSDLMLFLADLINSCPKACEQYNEWFQKKNI